MMRAGFKTMQAMTSQERAMYLAGWRDAMARAWPAVKAARQIQRKLDHGCYDAYCQKCDVRGG